MRNKYLIDVIQYMLEINSIYSNRKSIYKVLYSDPNFPSLASITATLSYFGIKNDAFLSDIEHLKRYKDILIHTKENEGHFYIVKEIKGRDVVLYDGENRDLTITKFRELWDGILLITNKEGGAPPSFRKLKIDILLPFSLIIISIYCCFNNSSNLVIPFLLDVIGIVCSYILLNQHFYEFSEQPLCKIGKRIDCEYVSQMNPFDKWLHHIDLSVIGIYFFLFDSIYLILWKRQDLFILSTYLCAIVFMLTLTSYQVLKIKRYCIYCLGITITVFLKLVTIDLASTNLNINSIEEFLIIILVTFSLCFLFYYYKKSARDLLNRDIELLRLKRNKQVLRYFFGNNNILLSTNDALRFGNPNADIQITTIINLNCKHCLKIRNEVNRLIETFPDKFLWNLIIDGNLGEEFSNEEFINKNHRQLYLYTLYDEKKNKCLEALKKGHFPKRIEISDKLLLQYRKMLECIKAAPITHYPTVLINGFILPYEYNISDLPYIDPEFFQSNHFSNVHQE